jgi:hypothetical protein
VRAENGKVDGARTAKLVLPDADGGLRHAGGQNRANNPRRPRAARFRHDQNNDAGNFRPLDDFLKAFLKRAGSQ